jgi:hypothetical protein
MATTVISVRGKIPAALLADPSFVYVGRQCAGWTRSIWGNPFKATRGDLMFIGRAPRWTEEMKEIAVQQYIVRFRACLETAIGEPWETMRRRLPELKGKTLGCWCGDWRPGEPEIPCHAVVLAKLADQAGDIA